MKRLFIFRHGIFNVDTGYLIEGTNDISVKASAEKIKEIIAEEKDILIVYSDLVRTKQTAEIISIVLEALEMEENKILNPEYSKIGEETENQICDLVLNKKNKVVILVTSKEFSEFLPYKILKKAGKYSKMFPPLYFGKFHSLEI